MGAFNRSHTANFIERDGAWHHMAVTWTKAGNGRTRIYKDGLLMAEVGAGPQVPVKSHLELLKVASLLSPWVARLSYEPFLV